MASISTTSARPSALGRCARALGRRARTRLRSGFEAGMSTAEYAVGTVAACGFAALLWTVLHSAAVQHALTGLVTRALGML